jgi:hypothetical protein
MGHRIHRRVANLKLPRPIKRNRRLAEGDVLDRRSLSLYRLSQRPGAKAKQEQQQNKEREAVGLRHWGFLCTSTNGAAEGAIRNAQMPRWPPKSKTKDQHKCSLVSEHKI